ncbi:endo alpha-1,4 polygalactosaminidase [Agrococcus sp. SGAir0287]|uniref:endo alpha-1,4 polygalactosaminidase n=1 Tax=Agrococcus sp. SGAir0287 TaxID=2070347 RepID=UPI0010CCD1D8|nr:endo alpha-1,4 polygalactosaminidase [Agrococcus sp. SGAir0287]QCR20753.1 hypothetical protein C1N71_08365 [Agrococcus sp. SGAir0287]
MRIRRLVVAVVATASLAGCATAGPGPVEAGGDAAERWEAASQGTIDYQLGGAYEPDPGTTIVARDASDPPADGAFSICYLNGFQTQPGDAAWWLDEHPDLLLRDDAGEPMIDPGWPDEMALDTSTADRRAAIAAIVQPWIAGCADAGYDAVELDNLDSWTRFEGLTMEGNLALAADLVAAIHDAGLWAAQKNALEAGEAGPDAGFDMVVTEECGQFDECADYAALYADRHIDVEYVESTSEASFLAMCDAGDVPRLSVLRDLALSVAGEADHVRVPCP